MQILPSICCCVGLCQRLSWRHLQQFIGVAAIRGLSGEVAGKCTVCCRVPWSRLNVSRWDQNALHNSDRPCTPCGRPTSQRRPNQNHSRDPPSESSVNGSEPDIKLVNRSQTTHETFFRGPLWSPRQNKMSALVGKRSLYETLRGKNVEW